MLQPTKVKSTWDAPVRLRNVLENFRTFKMTPEYSRRHWSTLDISGMVWGTLDNSRTF